MEENLFKALLVILLGHRDYLLANDPKGILQAISAIEEFIVATNYKFPEGTLEEIFLLRERAKVAR
jgi:hypothetical protein